jgi:hypothetical protein
MYNNRYEMDKLNEMNRQNVARTMAQYGAPVRKKRSIFRPSLRALLARIPSERQHPDGRLHHGSVR